MASSLYHRNEASADSPDGVCCNPEGFVGQAPLDGAYVLRTYAGRHGDSGAAYSTLNAAIAAFHAAPMNANPRLFRAGKLLVELDRQLTPIFSDTEAERIHRELFGGYVLRTYAGFRRGDVDTPHPTLEAALAAFAASPATAIPRVIRDGQTVAELDPEAGLTPIFGDAEVRRAYATVGAGGSPEATSTGPATAL